MSNFKIGGGNKPQPYIPAGNGEKSGEYTNKPQSTKEIYVFNCFIKNKSGEFNFLNSKLVRFVDYVVTRGSHTIPKRFSPNSVIKIEIDGNVISERYYNYLGDAYLDIDYTNHGNSKTHPEVPHIHLWTKINGELSRSKWEKFK